MIQGREKSRSAIVAVKPTNKAERTAAEQSAAEPNAAEPVERRAETKGSADQQRTRRTQRRITSRIIDDNDAFWPYPRGLGGAKDAQVRGGRVRRMPEGNDPNSALS